MALPFGRATFFGSGGAKGGSVFSEGRTIGSVFGVRGIRKENMLWCPENFEDQRKVLRPGAPEREICCGAPKTSQSGALAGKLHIDAPKGSEMNMKMTEAGHMGRKHSLMPRRMI